MKVLLITLALFFSISLIADTEGALDQVNRGLDAVFGGSTDVEDDDSAAVKALKRKNRVDEIKDKARERQAEKERKNAQAEQID